MHTGDADPTLNAAAATIDIGGLPLRAVGPGTWTDSLQVEVTTPDSLYVGVIAKAQNVQPGDMFNLTIRESADPQAATRSAPGADSYARQRTLAASRAVAGA